MIFTDAEIVEFANDIYNAVSPQLYYIDFIPSVFSKNNVVIDGQCVDINITMLKNNDETYYFYAAIYKTNTDIQIFPTKEFLHCNNIPVLDDYLKSFISFNQRISELFYCKCHDKLCYLW